MGSAYLHGHFPNTTLLTDFIVPSSSLSGELHSVARGNTDAEPTLACTSVPTEIAYHKGEDISADIFFIPRQDWRKFITLVLDDHTFRHARDEDEEDEGSQEPNDSDGPVEVAWQKACIPYTSILYRLPELSDPVPSGVPWYRAGGAL